MGWLKRLFKKENEIIDTNETSEVEQITDDVVDTNDTEDFITTEVVPDATMVQPGDYKPVSETKPLNLMKVKFEPAANQSRRRDKVRGICLHHIMMGSFRKNVDFLKSKESGVSAHYCLGRNGELVQMVNTTKKSWHAGVSEYTIGGSYRSNLNNCLIGIEIVNPGVLWKDKNGKFIYNCGGNNLEWKGAAKPFESSIVYPNGQALTGYSVPYTKRQIDKLVALCKALVEKYPDITRDDIVTHYQIAQPIGRKNDPFGLDLWHIKNLIFGS
jgi:N-acetyl-anhydromuramyl-L-alanine amidase AmpD